MLGLFLHVSVTRRCQAAGLVSRENEQSRAAGAGLSPSAVLSVLCHSSFASDSVAEVCPRMVAPSHGCPIPFLNLAEVTGGHNPWVSSSLKSVLTLTPPGCDHCLSHWALFPASLPCWLFTSPGTFWCSQHTGRAPHAHLDAPSPLRAMFLVPPPSVPTCFECWL